MSRAGQGTGRRRVQRAVAMVATALVAAMGIPPVTAGATEAPAVNLVHIGARTPLVLDPVHRPPTRVLPPELSASSTLAANATPATIQVTYTGFTVPARAAFQHAVNLWKTWVSSPVPIRIDAEWTSLPQGVLGSAGPTSVVRNAPGLVSGTWYPVALGNALSGEDLDPSSSDIAVVLSKTETSWYFGTDGNPGPGQVDFVSVALHELGHGLGFFGLASVSGGIGTRNYNGSPAIFDRFTKSGATDITSYADNSAALASALQGKVVRFTGPAAAAASGDAGPRLYAPAAWSDGSSYSHLDEATYPAGNANSLMTPAIGAGEAVHDLGPLSRALFADMGWSETIPTVPPTPTGVTAEPREGAAQVAFEVPGGSTGTSYTATSEPDGITASASASPIIVPGLTNGVSYTVTVTAENAQGPSTPSAPSNAVTPLALPTSVPTITAPTDGTSVQDNGAITAASLEAAVRFAVDGTWLGEPVAVTGGVASTSWSSIGSANGPHSIAAHSCSSLADWSCALTGASVSVSVANTTPVLTAPTSGQVVTGSMTMSATAGGAVAFLIDGVRRGFDAVGPYSVAASVAGLANGGHIATTKLCDSDGVTCPGTESAPVAFQVRNLLPKITSVQGSPFNPNGDGVRDTVKVLYSLPDRETATWSVLNAKGALVKGPVALGTVAAGAHSFTWNGKDRSGNPVFGGTYAVVLSTTGPWNGITLQGRASRTVVVDRSAPQLTAVSGNGTTFYPTGGGSPASFDPTATLNERAMLTLTVRDTAGALVRTLTASRGAGPATMTWKGGNTAGATVASGTYKWWLRAVDATGNARTIGPFTTKVVR